MIVPESSDFPEHFSRQFERNALAMDTLGLLTQQAQSKASCESWQRVLDYLGFGDWESDEMVMVSPVPLSLDHARQNLSENEPSLGQGCCLKGKGIPH